MVLVETIRSIGGQDIVNLDMHVDEFDQSTMCFGN